jgi:four helix bundle protein
MNYQEWAGSVPREITGDPLWRVEAYRLALFAAEVGWHDVTKLIRDQRTRSLSDQLYRALGSVSANIAEGYSRGTGRDRARFYEYALGSARESRDWYY